MAEEKQRSLAYFIRLGYRCSVNCLKESRFMSISPEDEYMVAIDNNEKMPKKHIKFYHAFAENLGEIFIC